MSKVILDASALLAFLRSEPGGDRVRDRLSQSQMSAVNLAEVVAKTSDYGGTIQKTKELLFQLPIEIVRFTAEDAYASGALRVVSRKHGLSLGDRCCLALGVTTGHHIMTTDKKWLSLDIGVSVEVIR